VEIHSRTAVIDGLSTSYLEAGHGDPVVLLHGPGPGVSAWANWQHIIPALAAGLTATMEHCCCWAGNDGASLPFLPGAAGGFR
jgi:pimeloyl-ACP methyl ester carboxylesterase